MKFYIFILFFLISGCREGQKPDFSLIAHAGGGYKGKTYTNSLEALDFNYEKGFRLFEIDFIWTSDKQLVCLHDWDRTPKWLLNYTEENPLSLNQFNQLKNQELSLKPCNLKRLNDWLHSHPEAFIVTDVKQNNIAALNQIKQQINNSVYKMIPQIYQPEEYEPTKALGYRNIIWTLYAYKGDNDQVIEETAHMNLFAVTMPKHRANQGLGKSLLTQKIATYVHTINDVNEALTFISDFGITSVYTDFINNETLINSSNK